MRRDVSPTAVPRGWYFAGPAHDLAPGQRRRVHLAGADVRLTRDASGGVTARTDAGVLPVATANGLVLVWFAPGGEPPTFEIPALDTHGWSQPLFTSVTVATSPETVMMDLADTVHFTTIHGYRQVTPAEPLTHDGAQLRVAFTMLRRLWGDRLGLDQQVLLRCWAWGMGYQVAQVESFGGYVTTRHFVLPTPIDRHTTRVDLGLSIRLNVEARLAPRGAHALRRPVMRSFTHDVARDAHAWLGRYPGAAAPELHEPELRLFRAWAQQFYA